jgi:hypothetical protein
MSARPAGQPPAVVSVSVGVKVIESLTIVLLALMAFVLAL